MSDYVYLKEMSRGIEKNNNIWHWFRSYTNYRVVEKEMTFFGLTF